MPGHNGGYNPYRDRNGEFTTPAGAGKPGRSRSISSGRKAPGVPQGIGRSPTARTSNPRSGKPAPVKLVPRDQLIANFKHPATKASAIAAARSFLQDAKSTPEQLYDKLGAWETQRMQAGRKNDKEERVMAAISQALANTMF
ncbi:hypothetical protein K2Z83_13370 [Oscillochloris sp. ZM17-4]|uniref:hypothetical protein n=1 Tax=Oscillochloris sp. ZM17-4 TaxID=2866714 RepID=UPI001C72E03A|nr:hypothetical protein [Oscillochloris sp. ZM17-4]MBX0328666.1 hypothetical protein [Oscillochloris sp. ZM17-4]